MALNPNEIAERMRLAGEEWSDLDYAASLLEETKKSVYSKLFLEAKEKTIAEREAWANAHPSLFDHVEKMTAARREANKAKVRYDCAKEWTGLVRTSEATKRAELRG